MRSCPWWKLQEHGLALHDLRLVATLCALGAAALFLLVPQRWTLALPLLVLVYFCVVQQPVQARAELASRNARAAGIGGRLDWIDRAVRGDDVVGVLWAGRTDPHVVWENEFFNRSVGPVYDVAQPMPGNLLSTPVRVGTVGVLRGQPPERLLLSDGTLDLRGARRVSDVKAGVSVWAVVRPVRSVTDVRGLYPGESWSGPIVVYRRIQCAGGAVRVDVLGDPSLFRRPQTVRANGVAYVVRPGVRTGITVPLDQCAARFVVSPTRVPGGIDQRRLGIHFLTFAYAHR